MHKRALGVSASVIALGVLTAACGNTDNERAATGALSGAAIGGLIGGPVGFIVGGGVGGAGGYAIGEPLPDILKAGGRETRAAMGMPREPAAGAPAEPTGPMTAEMVHDRLHAEGYERVNSVRQHGDIFTARAYRGGRAYNIVVDAGTGRTLSITPAGAASGAPIRGGQQSELQRVRSTLQQAGYSNVSNIRAERDVYTARAQRDGNTYMVEVNPDTGRILSSQQVSPADQQQMQQPGPSPQSGAPGQIPGAMEQQIRQTLQQEGYTNVSSIRQSGDFFIAQAERDNQRYLVQVDPRAGRVISAQPAP
jgi:hypothetical protein